MNYKKKIQEIQTMINIINKYYINQVANLLIYSHKKLDVLTKKHYQLLNKYYEKSQDISSAIVTFFQATFIIAIGITILKFLVNN